MTDILAIIGIVVCMALLGLGFYGLHQLRK